MELIFGLIVKKQINRYFISVSYSWSPTINIEDHPIRYYPLKATNNLVVGGERE